MLPQSSLSKQAVSSSTCKVGFSLSKMLIWAAVQSQCLLIFGLWSTKQQERAQGPLAIPPTPSLAGKERKGENDPVTEQQPHPEEWCVHASKSIGGTGPPPP